MKSTKIIAVNGYVAAACTVETDTDELIRPMYDYLEDKLYCGMYLPVAHFSYHKVYETRDGRNYVKVQGQRYYLNEFVRV